MSTITLGNTPFSRDAMDPDVLRWRNSVLRDGGEIVELGLADRLTKELRRLGRYGADTTAWAMPARKAGRLYSLRCLAPTDRSADIAFVRASTKRVFNQAESLVSVAIDRPAFEWNPGGTYRGLLIEPAASNLVLRTEEFDNAYWTKTRTTISANVTTSPALDTSADKLIASVDTNTHYLSRGVTGLSNGVLHTISVFAKAGEYNFIRVELGENSQGAYFNLATGVVVSTSGSTTSQIQSLGNGWYRCSISTLSISTTVTSVFAPSPNGSTINFTGDGTSGIFIWGAQLETGSVATSYIPTVTSTVTRVADSVTLTGAGGFIGQTQGYFGAGFRIRLAGTDRTIYTAYADANNHITLRLNSSNQLVGEVVSGGVTQATFTSATLSENTVYGAVLSYSAGAVLLSLNGAQVGTTDTSATIPATSALGAGISRNGDQRLNGWLRAMVNDKTALSAADANALSLSLAQL